MTGSTEKLPARPRAASDISPQQPTTARSYGAIRSGNRVALNAPVQRGRIAGWQLPYLRVALILRRLEYDARETLEIGLVKREIENVERMHGEVRRAGWFN